MCLTEAASALTLAEIGITRDQSSQWQRMAEGTAPTLCVIDGRNRISACKRAGVAPHYVTLNGEDQDAFIADANLERRDLTKGQKAMLVAIRFPEPGKRGRGNKSTVSDDFRVSETRIKNARTVLQFCPEMVDPVIEGKTGLDEAYAEANRRKLAGQANEARFETLRVRDPDLADLVQEQRMPITAGTPLARGVRNVTETRLILVEFQIRPSYPSHAGIKGSITSIPPLEPLPYKAEAIASYARQSKDESLQKMCIRIQARAIRRCGELLKYFQTGPRGGRPEKNEEGALPVSEKAAATDAGMSEWQRKTAVRVANVPTDDFERQVVSDKPPTVTKLAEQGKRKPLVEL